MQSEHNAAPSAAAPGLAMVAAAILAVIAMAHHPTSAHGAQSGVGALVHPAMMIFLLTLFVGFATASRRRGFDRTLVLAASIVYGASLAAHLGAATINGFIAPALASRPEPPSHDIFLLCWEANQALARLGVYATGAAYVLWSLDLLRAPGLSNRMIALIGFAAGALPAIALAGGALKMDVHGAFAVYAMHLAWAALIGMQLIRRQL